MMMNGSKRFLSGERGSSSAEYAVMFALVLALVLASVTALSRRTGDMWGSVDSELVHTGHSSY